MNTPRKPDPAPAPRIARWAGLLLIIILASGTHYTIWTVGRADRELRADFTVQVQRLASGLSLGCLPALQGDESDLARPHYQRLKQQLAAIKQIYAPCRFAHLMGVRDDGTTFFYADSEAPGSPDYSPPGQVYDEADPVQTAALRSGKSVVEGPLHDRWGTWVSGSVPLLDPHSRTLRAILGLDIEARTWQRNLAYAALRPVLITLTGVTLVLVGAVLLRRRQRLGTGAPRWLWRLEPALAITLGLSLTFFVAWRARERQLRNNIASFTRLADSETRRIADVLQDVDGVHLASLARFLESRGELSGAEFAHFTQPLTRNPAVRAWEWLPAITAAERAQFEQTCRAAGQPDFEIWERDAQGKPVPAEPRETVYPVCHAAPLSGNAVALGFDVGSEPVRRAALEEAERSGLPTATEPIALVQDSQQQPGLAIFHPVYYPGEPRRLRGFAVAVLQLGNTVESVQDKAAVHLVVSLLRPGQEDEFLASSCTENHNPAQVPARPVAAFGRILLLQAYPQRAFLDTQSSSAAPVAALRGLALTVALTLLVGVPLRRREELEHLVEQRTAELSAQEERLTATLHSMRDGVIESDAEGRVVNLNPAAEQLTGWTAAAARGHPVAAVFRSRPDGQRTAGEGAAVNPAETAVLVAVNNVERQVSGTNAQIRGPNGSVLGAVRVFRDVTREHHAQRLAELRLELLEYAPAHTLDELMTRTLDEICALLGSPIGFYHFVDDDERTLTLQQWSTSTLAGACQTQAKGRHYDLDQAGVWVDCVRERKPVVHNDYATLPNRRGMPPGHPAVVRELTTPVRRGNRVVAILGVGNKPADYTTDDVETISYLADVTWHMIEQKQAAEALRKSQERYDQLAAQTRTFTWEVDAAGLYTHASSTVEPVLGYHPEDLVGKLHFYDLHPLAGRAEYKAAAFAAFERRAPFVGLGNAAVTRDGRQLWLSTDGIPMLGVDGTLLGYRGADTDITVRRQTEQNYQNLFQKMLDGFALHEIICDAQGKPVDYRFLSVNPAFERMTGLRAQEIIGKAAREILPGLEPFWIETYGKVALSGEPVTFERHSQGLDKDFTVAAFSPAPRQFACIVADITARRRLEAEHEKLLAEAELSRRALLSVLDDEKRLAAERARLAAGIEQAAEVILITDPTGTIQYVNPAFETVTGYRREEALGQNPRFLMGDPENADLFRELWDTISAGQVWKGRFASLRKDGTPYTADATVSPVRDATGQIANYVAVNRDVTEHLLVTQQLQQAQKMDSVGRLAGGVAHDFNNLLMGIMNYVELCRDGLAPDHPIREYLDEITTEGQRSANLTRQLLAFARKQVIAPKLLDLNDAVTSMLNLLRRLIGENIDLAWAPGTALWPIMMDPSQVDQILANLCVNARDAISGTGKLTVRTANVTLDQTYCSRYVGSAPGDYVCLTVSDTGCGMTPAVLDHVFEPFFTTKGVGKGTGLGLATVYGIVMQNAGSIQVTSAPGQGTTFRIHLPRVHGQSVIKDAPPPPVVRPRGNETILLVEDETSLLVTTRLFLQGLGYTVLPAEAPAAALALAAQYPGTIHLLFTDVIMPGMNGKDLATHLAAARPGVPCLYMSGYTADAFAHLGVLDPGVRFLPKPFSRDTLALAVRAALDGHQHG
jgi:PAS domain S-box-containing protein